jgi:hypothetical protein
MTTTEIAGFVGATLAGAAYVPQLSRLMARRCSAGISLLAQEVWLLASLLTTAHATADHAGVFIALGGTQIVSTALVLFLASRYRNTPCPNPFASPVHRQDRRGDREPRLQNRCPPLTGLTTPRPPAWSGDVEISPRPPGRPLS